jgi:hypothetical protein
MLYLEVFEAILQHESVTREAERSPYASYP